MSEYVIPRSEATRNFLSKRFLAGARNDNLFIQEKTAVSQRFYFYVVASAVCFDRHGRIFPQKYSKDRKMEDRKMFTVCFNQSSSTFRHDAKLHFLSFVFLSWLLFMPT